MSNEAVEAPINDQGPTSSTATSQPSELNQPEGDGLQPDEYKPIEFDETTRIEVITLCDAIVDQFHQGELSQGDAFIALVTSIPGATDPGAGNDALIQYVQRISASAHASQRASKRSRENRDNDDRAPEANLANNPTPGTNQRPRDASPSDTNDNINVPVSQLNIIRANSPFEDLLDSKWVKLNRSRLPWLKGRDPEGLFLSNPVLEETRLQLLEWSKDVKTVLSTVVNSDHNVSFPDSQWLALLKGQTVDFDKIHTHRLSIASSTKESRRIAEGVDFVIGESEPTKYIRNAHEWQDAWDRFYKAVKFISPHRKQELKDYHDWIKGRFEAYHPSAHYRVLDLDRKIRVEAASRRDLALNDFHKYSHFETSFTSDSGNGHLASKMGSNRGSSGRDQRDTPQIQKVQVPCNRFNQGRCPSTPSKCKYLHICSHCRKGSHVMEKCTNPPDRA